MSLVLPTGQGFVDRQGTSRHLVGPERGQVVCGAPAGGSVAEEVLCWLSAVNVSNNSRQVSRACRPERSDCAVVHP